MFTKIQSRVFTLIPLLGLAACAGVEPINVPAELQPIEEPAFEVRTAWRDSTGGVERYARLRPLIVDETVYVVDGQGEARALALEDGKLRWRRALDAEMTAGVSGGPSLLVVGTRDGEAIALDAEDGEVLWRQRLSTEVMAFSRAESGVIVAHTIDSHLHGLAVNTGEILWDVDRNTPALSLRGASEPVLAGGRVVAGLANGELLAVSSSRGNVLWETSIALPEGRSELERLVDIDGRIKVAEGIVYAVSYQGRAAAITLSEGRELWSKESSSYTGLDIDRERVYITDQNSHVWALERGTGAAMWRQDDLEHRGLTAPTVAGDYLVVGDYEGYLHWIEKESGRLVARRHVGGGNILAAPQVFGSRVYALGKEGRIAAVEPMLNDDLEDRDE